MTIMHQADVESAIGDDPKLAKIIRQIQHLLAIATDERGNENMAAAAAEKAQELLEKYNLDMAVLGQQTGDTGKREDKRLSGGLYKWQRILWEAVAQLHYCYYWSIKGTEKGSKYEHRIVGRTVNVLSARLMAEYLQDAIERIAREEYENKPSLYFSKPAIAYREGMADRLSERLWGRRHEREWAARREAAEAKRRAEAAGQSASTAITLADLTQREREANDDFLYGEGWTNRRRIRATEWEREQREAREKAAEDERRWREQNPELAARMDAERLAEQRKEEARERRNANRRKGSAYREPKRRDNKYYDGVSQGNRIGIDPQVNEGARKGALPTGS